MVTNKFTDIKSRIKSWMLLNEYKNYLNILIVVFITILGIILLTNGMEKTDDGAGKSDKKTILTLTRDIDYRIGRQDSLGPNCFFVENDSTVYVCDNFDDRILKYIDGKIDGIFPVNTGDWIIDIFVEDSKIYMLDDTDEIFIFDMDSEITYPYDESKNIFNIVGNGSKNLTKSQKALRYITDIGGVDSGSFTPYNDIEIYDDGSVYQMIVFENDLQIIKLPYDNKIFDGEETRLFNNISRDYTLSQDLIHNNLPTQQPVEGTEIIGFITNIDKTNMKISFDEVEWVQSEDIDRIKELDLPDVIFDSGFFIYNENETIKTLGISNDAVYYVLDGASSYKTNIDGLIALDRPELLCNLTIDDGVIVKINEQYRP